MTLKFKMTDRDATVTRNPSTYTLNYLCGSDLENCYHYFSVLPKHRIFFEVFGACGGTFIGYRSSKGGHSYFYVGAKGSPTANSLSKSALNDDSKTLCVFVIWLYKA